MRPLGQKSHHMAPPVAEMSRSAHLREQYFWVRLRIREGEDKGLDFGEGIGEKLEGYGDVPCTRERE